MTDFMRDELGAPKMVDRSTFQAGLDALRVREKAHTKEGDAIAAARRRLPMVEVDGATPPHATFCQGPYEESARYRDFMGWEMPWSSAQDSLDTLLVGRRVGMMHIVCYLRQGSNVFETYWTTIRGVEAMDNSYRLLDLTAYGRRETWEDSPPGWLKGKQFSRVDGRPTAQWSRLKAGHSDDLATGSR